MTNDIKTPTPDNPELVASFTFCGATHRIVAYYRDVGRFDFWHADYQRMDGGVAATINGETREQLLERIIQFMEAHGRQLMWSLITDAEAGN